MRVVSRLASMLMFSIIAAILAMPAMASPAPAPSTAAPAGVLESNLGSLARRSVELANQERVRTGLNPLRWNDQLAASATAYAEEMAAKNFFAHNGPDGSTPTDRARRAGYPAYGWGGLYVGENLGRGYNTADSVHQAWMASEGHRANLLLPKYREIGIGLAIASNGTVYWAQAFGSRPNSFPVFIDEDAAATESPKVTLTLTDEEVSPWGSLASVAAVMISNRPDFLGSVWEPFSKTKEWTLQGRPGPQAVYVRIRDVNGQVVDSSDDIQYMGRVALSEEEPEAIAEVQPQPQDEAQALDAAPADESGNS